MKQFSVKIINPDSKKEINDRGFTFLMNTTKQLDKWSEYEENLMLENL